MKKKTSQTAKAKLTLDDFKKKSSLSTTDESLEAITGGILGACQDTPPSTNSRTPVDGDKKLPR